MTYMTEPGNVLRVRDIKPEDLTDVAAVHKSCFPASMSLFSALDDEFVKRYYALAVEEPVSMGVVLEDLTKGKVVGFAIGTTVKGYRKRFIMHNFLWVCWCIFKGLLTSSDIWKAVWERVKNLKKILAETPKAGGDTCRLPETKGAEAIFMPIAVHPDYRGGGNAGRLASYMTEKLFATGAERVVGIIAPDNIASLKLFRRLGWSEAQTAEQWFSVWIDKEVFYKSKPQ